VEEYFGGTEGLTSGGGRDESEQVSSTRSREMEHARVVCHLLDFEPIGADRMKRIMPRTSPPCSGPTSTLASACIITTATLEEELTMIERTRSQMARILRKMPAKHWLAWGNPQPSAAS